MAPLTPPAAVKEGPLRRDEGQAYSKGLAGHVDDPGMGGVKQAMLQEYHRPRAIHTSTGGGVSCNSVRNALKAEPVSEVCKQEQ